MTNDNTEESTLIAKGPCDNCGSSDANALYSDGHTHCFSCGVTLRGGGEAREAPKRRSAGLIQGDLTALVKRKLTEETCRKFNYRVGRFNGKTAQIASYRDWEGNEVAQKLRFADKKEGLPWLGDNKDVALFGAHLWGRGKMIVITEGEIDAMTVSQAQDNKWPVVSLINGASGARKDISNALPYLANFERIILMFDMDEPGRKAVEEAASVLTGHKVFVATLPLKDASDCHVVGNTKAIVSAIWDATPWSPKSVVSGEDIITRRRNRPKVHSFSFPDWMPKLNEMVFGYRFGELVTWTSGTGMGKTTLLRQLQIDGFRRHGFNQALIMLEEPLEDTADETLSVFMGKRLKLPEVAETVTEEQIQAAEEELFLAEDEDGNKRFYFHDAFGSMDSDDDLMNRIRYFAHAKRCRVVWLDHLSILVSGMGEEGDERRRIDAIVHNLKSLAVELNITIHLISHLKKASGPTSFEEGAIPSLDDLRGSGGIKQLSDAVYAISRNQQADTETERNTAQLHSLKSRYTGATGRADFVFYNKLTGLFEPGTDPSDQTFEDETGGDY